VFARVEEMATKGLTGQKNVGARTDLGREQKQREMSLCSVWRSCSGSLQLLVPLADSRGHVRRRSCSGGGTCHSPHIKGGGRVLDVRALTPTPRRTPCFPSTCPCFPLPISRLHGNSPSSRISRRCGHRRTRMPTISPTPPPFLSTQSPRPRPRRR